MLEGISRLKRAQVLERDGQRCKICGSNTHLEVHHILAISEALERRLPRKLVNHHENLVTMCQPCHSLTYGNLQLKYWLTPEEASELRSILPKREQLSKEREQIKSRYYRMWDVSSYASKKKELDTKLKKLDQRAVEIRGDARQRLFEMQERVYNTLLTITQDTKELRITDSLL